MSDEPTRPSSGASAVEPVEPPSSSTESSTGESPSSESAQASGAAPSPASQRSSSPLHSLGRFVRELVIIVVIALVASALLRAFVVQAFFVPTGSMLPEIQLHDRIVVSRLGDLHRGEVVVFEDPGGWIPGDEQPPPPGNVRKALEWVGVLPASGHEHLVKRLIGLPGDHVVCCDAGGKLTINGVAVDESGFIRPGNRRADDVSFDVVVPKDRMFVLGDNRYVSGDSSRHLGDGQGAFVPTDDVTGRAMAVIWPAGNFHRLLIPDAYDDVPDGRDPPDKGVIRSIRR